VPVHENIKSGRGDLRRLFDNYAQTLRNLATEGLTTVVYNFMPVLDWIRTDMHYKLSDGSESMHYDPGKFYAFEAFVLNRSGAEADYTPEQIERGFAWWRTLDDAARGAFTRDIIDVFPGVKRGMALDDIRTMLAQYAGFKTSDLEINLKRFLEAIVPVAEKLDMKLAIHADDPPFPVLGLPRIVSTANQLRSLLKQVDSPANGLCFCTGSLSAHPSNDLPTMLREFSPRIHAVHLRSTQRLPDGSFYEADHLAGSVDMPAIMRELLREQDRRRSEGRSDWRLSFRPDHGHVMMDDLNKSDWITPGYSCIGRMRGLSELRGLMLGLRHQFPADRVRGGYSPSFTFQHITMKEAK
jgi:mannonate dehydratase